MRVIIGSDDEGPVLDAALAHIRSKGIETQVAERGAWPDVARIVAEAVVAGNADQGILMCWTGTGTSMMANKVMGARAALAWDPWIAQGARRWNDANILVMSLKRTTPEDVPAILDAWFAVEEPDPDEVENVKKMTDYEGGPHD